MFDGPQASDARIAIVGAQPTRVGQFGCSVLAFALEAIGRSEVGAHLCWPHGGIAGLFKRADRVFVAFPLEAELTKAISESHLVSAADAGSPDILQNVEHPSMLDRHPA